MLKLGQITNFFVGILDYVHRPRRVERHPRDHNWDRRESVCVRPSDYDMWDGSVCATQISQSKSSNNVTRINQITRITQNQLIASNQWKEIRTPYLKALLVLFTSSMMKGCSCKRSKELFLGPRDVGWSWEGSISPLPRRPFPDADADANADADEDADVDGVKGDSDADGDGCVLCSPTGATRPGHYVCCWLSWSAFCYSWVVWTVLRLASYTHKPRSLCIDVNRLR